MNKNAFTTANKMIVITSTGKLPDNVGFSTCKGVTRSLTVRELKQQKDLQKSNTRF
jgi:hypothetical protein